MQDITKRKPKVINLRKNKKPVRVSKPKQIIVETQEVQPAKQREWTGGEFPCADCGMTEAIELGRCRSCDVKHREIVTRFDSRPKGESLPKTPAPIASIRKEVSQGVIVTVQTLTPLR